MFRSLLGFAIFAVIAIFLFKIFLGLFGLLIGLLLTVAWFAFMEGTVKAIATLLVSAPSAREVVLSGRTSTFDRVRVDLTRRLSALAPQVTVHALRGLAKTAKQGAQGAALVADGLAGGRESELVSTLGIRRASGTALDHLVSSWQNIARARLGIVDA